MHREFSNALGNLLAEGCDGFLLLLHLVAY